MTKMMCVRATYKLSEDEEDESEYEEDKEDEDVQVNNDKGDLQHWRV